MQAVVLCECGCGAPAPITRGKQKRFVSGHNGRLNLPLVRVPYKRGAANIAWRGDAAASNGIHTWIRRNWAKARVCEECGAKGKTDWAFLRHPAPHTRERGDYRELCRSCHLRFDRPWACKP
jgi:hypothetical protein